MMLGQCQKPKGDQRIAKTLLVKILCLNRLKGVKTITKDPWYRLFQKQAYFCKLIYSDFKKDSFVIEVIRKYLVIFSLKLVRLDI